MSPSAADNNATHVFDANENRMVPRAHPVGPALPTPDYKPDPHAIKRPALFLHLGGLRVSGNPNATVQFAGLGVITREAMRDLISLFQAWDAEENLR